MAMISVKAFTSAQPGLGMVVSIIKASIMPGMSIISSLLKLPARIPKAGGCSIIETSMSSV